MKLMDNIHESKATAEEVFIIPVRMISIRLNEAEIVLSKSHPVVSCPYFCSLNTPCRMLLCHSFWLIEKAIKENQKSGQ